jgi:hypothetical protein
MIRSVVSTLKLAGVLALTSFLAACTEGEGTGSESGGTGGTVTGGTGGTGGTVVVPGGGGEGGSEPVVTGTIHLAFKSAAEANLWEVNYAEEGVEPTKEELPALREKTEISFADKEGNPDAGALLISVPFDSPNQAVMLQTTVEKAVDLSGRTVTAKIKLTSALNTVGGSGYAKLYVKSNGEDWANGPQEVFEGREGEWITLAFNVEEPDFVNDGFDKKNVNIFGVLVGSGAGEVPLNSKATVFFDSIAY